MKTITQEQKPDIKKLLKIFPLFAFIITLSVYYLYATAKTMIVGKNEEVKEHSAFNMKLPAPSLNEHYKNKLDIYMQARQDSMQTAQKQQRDFLLTPDVLKESYVYADTAKRPIVDPKRQTLAVDENERKVSETLDKLYKEINRSAADSLPSSVIKSLPSVTTGSSAEIDQLEKIMSTINTSGEDDREMKRLDGMLDKILLIQNPAAFRASAAPSIADKSLPVSARSQSVTQPASPVEQQGFYGLNSSTIDTGASLPHGFLAVIHDDRTVQDGATVKLRLLQDIYVGNIVIPENSFLYGQSSLGNQRLNIEIKNAVINNRIVPVRLSVYDIDGITGIYCPGAVSQEVARNGLNQAIQNLELYSVDPSIGAQAATAGIQAAKSLVGKKAKAVNVSLKTGHTVLLYNSQN